MQTGNIHLFVFDTRVNFELSKGYLGSEGSSFKKIICVEDFEEFKKEFNHLHEDDLAFMVVHAFYTDKISGIKRFVASRIGKTHPNLGFMYISEGDSKSINKQMVEEEIPISPVYKYHQVQSSLEDEKFRVYTKKDIIQPYYQPSLPRNEDYPQCDYVIITALEEDEMEQVLPMIIKDGKVKNTKHLIEYGHLEKKSHKKIAYASQLSTGMIDASILATEMLIMFKPKFLIMTGVLGGKPFKTEIGDVVVSTKVFTIDKGKLTEEDFQKELEASNTDSSFITGFKREKEKIKESIKISDPTRKNNINIHFEPIACVRQVIDKENYFVENISTIDRKAIALEMESYGIARACELVNDGQTIPLIIKSVMDNTQVKTDNAKPYAAWTSAMFLKYILENDLI